MSWTEERIDRLKTMWAEGMTASQIALALGQVTRNAVIGKVHRLGLSGRVTAARPERPRAATQPRPQVRVAQIAAPTPVIEEPLEPMPGDPVTVLSLSGAMCKWPLGDPSKPDFRFCGRKSKAGAPYCEHHSRMAYQPAQMRRDRDRGRFAG